MGFLKLIRYKNLLMVLLTMVLTKYALIHSFIENSYLSHLEFFILILSVLSITAGGYIINDINDVKADKTNKPDKVYIDVLISKKMAWRSYFALTFFGLIVGLILSFYKSLEYYSFIFILTFLGLFFYSRNLKKLSLVGNLVTSIFSALVIYIVYLFCVNYIEIEKTSFEEDNSTSFLIVWLLVSLFAFFAFLTTLIREIIKDIEDINGDLKIKAKTLPIIIGRKRASKVAFFFTCILLVFLFIVLQFLKNDYLFLGYGIIFILLPLLYFMYKLWSAETKKDFSKLSSLMKIIMFLGILSMLLFKFQ